MTKKTKIDNKPEGYKTCNAMIKDINLGFDKPNSLCVAIRFVYPENGNVQELISPTLEGKFTDSFIRGLLKISGANTFDGIKGKKIRVKMTVGKILAMGHEIDDKWMLPRTMLDMYPSDLKEEMIDKLLVGVN